MIYVIFVLKKKTKTIYICPLSVCQCVHIWIDLLSRSVRFSSAHFSTSYPLQDWLQHIFKLIFLHLLKPKGGFREIKMFEATRTKKRHNKWKRLATRQPSHLRPCHVQSLGLVSVQMIIVRWLMLAYLCLQMHRNEINQLQVLASMPGQSQPSSDQLSVPPSSQYPSLSLRANTGITGKKKESLSIICPGLANCDG